MGLICNRQNSGFLFLYILTANSISIGHPTAAFPKDKIRLEISARGIIFHFNIGAKEMTRVPDLDKESRRVLSSLEITLPSHLRAPSSSALCKEKA